MLGQAAYSRRMRRLGTPGGCCSRAATEPSCSWPPASPSSPRSTVRGPWQAAPAFRAARQLGARVAGPCLYNARGRAPQRVAALPPARTQASSCLTLQGTARLARRDQRRTVLQPRHLHHAGLQPAGGAALCRGCAPQTRAWACLALSLCSVQGLEAAPGVVAQSEAALPQSIFNVLAVGKRVERQILEFMRDLVLQQCSPCMHIDDVFDS